MSSIQHVDKIIVLDNGQIAEMGTHNELFEKEGIYFEMYQQQLSK
jgi:ABC-type multidrug transport system fused ATPase/permease subunit